MIIHDLEQEEAQQVLAGVPDSGRISDNGTIRSCTGCFGCWIKTPGQCVIKDGYENMGELLGKTTELIVISKCCYGSFSPFVKNVFDRSISYIHPYFKIRNREMHHKRRYNNVIQLKVFFYGEELTQQEKNTAAQYLEAVCLNLDCSLKELKFLTKKELMEGCIC
ncbi:multimeric flavodoxin WrbA [Anaerotaenia torta]|uniref:flavodoxin family protein n=1 Tax=Anaerotaenia torta TaxID=433293 RepID=UPI003D24D517